jgi:hypothetical protein
MAGAPLAAFCCGNALFSEPKADERIRKPKEPVSTSTPLMFWQFEVPGAHTVTVVNAPFA